MFKFLDIFFLVFHSFLILFNLFGWMWKKTRRLNLITLLLTGFSWVGLGLFYGWGYCFLTDWHWQVLEKTGELNLPNSYVQYLLNRILGLQISVGTADYLTGILYAIALLLSVYSNLKSRSKV
ncbi:MAG: DUF2784 domain-containing protein [Bacteroidales bacterium]|nr:DUF2784 domain-containing protein [Bacteroidales bacterium]